MAELVYDLSDQKGTMDKRRVWSFMAEDFLSKVQMRSIRLGDEERDLFKNNIV